MSKQTKTKKAAKASKDDAPVVPQGPQLSLMSFLDPAPLSPHPDVDRYLPKVLIGSICAVTGLMAMVELCQHFVAPLLFSPSEEAEDAEPEQEGQFSRKYTIHDKPIPIERWPRNVDGKLIFQPTYDWQEVPEDCVLPAGLQIEMDTQTGKKKARAKKQ